MVNIPETKREAPLLAQPKDLPGQAGTYYLFKAIDEAEAGQFCAALWAMANALVEVPGSRITVLINSGGGSVGAGFAMIEMMYKVKRELGVSVDTVILGYAYSMGAVIFEAGDQRRMGYFSTMMLHSSSWQVSGRDSEVFTDIKKLADLYQGMTAELFHRRTGLHSPSWWRRFIYAGRERYLSAQECLKLQLVDEVCQFLDECYLPSPSGPETADDQRR
ncbi:MAG: ATP-dependent Clp protease proteolytic subunit [Chloroflexi bacterium]|nr:ATP-dependent Clp protease proteolytic subunit [Chloroflexota bacterium]